MVFTQVKFKEKRHLSRSDCSEKPIKSLEMTKLVVTLCFLVKSLHNTYEEISILRI